MGIRKERFSLSGFLLDVGGRILFCPDNSFSSYGEKTEEKQDGKKHFFLLPYKKKVKGALAKMAEQSAVLTLLNRGIVSLFSTRIRSFGVLFFVCGFLQILSYFLGAYVSFLPGGEDNLLFGVAQIFLTLLCSFSRGTVSDGLKKSFLFRGLIRPLFGVQEWAMPTGKSRDSLGEMFLGGVLFGAVSVFFGPVAIAKILVYSITFLVIFSVPEVGLGVCVVAILFFDGTTFCHWVFVTLAAFLCKCAVGKRSLVFSRMDLPVLLFLLPLAATEKGVSFAFSFFALYFLASGLIRTLSSLERLMRLVTLTAFGGAMLILLRWGMELLSPAVFLQVPDLLKLFFLEATPAVGLVFAMFCPLLMGYGRSRGSVSKKLLPFLAFVLSAAVLVLAKDSNVWLCAIFGVAIYILFSYRWALLVLVMGGLSLITALFVLPAEFSGSVLRFFGLDVALVPAGDSILSLVGYFFSRGGIFWPFIYFFVVGFFLWGCIRFAANTHHPAAHRLLLGALSAGAAFFLSSFQSLQLDGRSLALFLFLASLPDAAYRCAKREEIRLPY